MDKKVSIILSTYNEASVIEETINKIFKYLNNDRTIFEKDCLPKLTKLNQLLAFKHNGFWGCMDTIREKKELNKIWKSKQKAWKVWF